MVELSVGEVSGLIAAGVFVLQTLLALIFPAALVGFVGEENTAVTWSVLGRALQSSPWPSVLQTDAAARHGVLRRVSNGLLLQTAIVLLVSVAAIVTPLGLYQAVEPGGQQLEAFQFLRDDSSFGFGTPDRMAGPFSRSCGNNPCPGSWKNETCVQQGLLERCTVAYGRVIPDDWRTTLRKGASAVGRSVSSIFDVQWRSQVNATDGLGSLGWYLKSGYRQMGILILDPTIQLVDGLIVDAQNGGIGFRNHTVPLPVHEYGSIWSEDILFVEPEAQCVDLNVTFDFELPQRNDGRLSAGNLTLTDRGGFSKLSRTSPNLTISDEGNGQGAIDLKDRAYKAAWANNFLTLAYFNLTDPDSTNITRLDVAPGMGFRGSSAEICAGGSSADFANINSTIVGCGLVYGTARRTDGGSELSPQPGSTWSIPVYSCAASVRATIRTVAFRYNGTGFAALKVTSARPKTYASPSDVPLWAVEDMHSTILRDAQPLWGLLGSSNTTTAIPPALAANISTARQASLRLPGFLTADSIIGGNDWVSSKIGQNLPGVDFYVQALQNAFTIAAPGTVGYEGYTDYSGMTGLALYTKWKRLSASAEGAAEIIKLVWTDIAANSVVGTKGWGLDDPAARGVTAPWDGAAEGRRKRAVDGAGGGSAGGNQAEDEMVSVTVYRRRVRYSLPYMVPAIVVLALAVGVVGTWLVLLVLGRTGPVKMRRLLDATSAGRILGGFLWPEKSVSTKRTDEWVKTVGTKVVLVGSGKHGAVAVAEGKGGQERDMEGRVDGEESIQLMGKDRPT
ncbi:hypothetical protein NEMBOFW57_006658 [Staphylotrichum longicolle]|uniref:Uncharacterized protein n=1 Tax=Staphylotrichum longicolle TaxID=669026 RepID=A0AAD4EXH0_9PEZI|nr:hypothetical protein NEMBOFW57_006658 [Staphylotrichum longicolle]